MLLTPAQQAIVKADIIANPDLDAWPHGPDGAFEIAKAYNLPASPNFPCWRNNTPTQAIFDAISWDKYTPVDAADETLVYMNRLLLIQTKQMNLQTLLLPAALDTTKANIRAGVRDATIQIPAGVGGAGTAPGGTNGGTVLAACIINGSRIEKLLTTGTFVTGNTSADVRGFYGAISRQDVDEARES